jgi:hypothetical protein
MAKLSDEQLSELQALNKKNQELRLQLGELEVQKAMIIPKIETLRLEFVNLEANLVAEYGENSVININTGEVSEKEKKIKKRKGVK